MKPALVAVLIAAGMFGSILIGSSPSGNEGPVPITIASQYYFQHRSGNMFRGVLQRERYKSPFARTYRHV